MSKRKKPPTLLRTPPGILIPHEDYAAMVEWENRILETSKKLERQAKELKQENEQFRASFLQLNQEILDLTLKVDDLKKQNAALQNKLSKARKRKEDEILYNM